MGRPKKYATHEDRLAARRAMSEAERRAAGIGPKTRLPEEERIRRERESRMKWKDANREAVNASARASRAGKDTYKKYIESMTPERRAEFHERRAAYRENNREVTRQKMRDYYQKNADFAVWTNLKTKAKKLGIPFDIEPEDIRAPEFCPVLGIKLGRGREHQQLGTSPSVDRLEPSKGYVKGNVIVVSYRVNRIKNDATVGELVAVARFYEKLFAERKIQ